LKDLFDIHKDTSSNRESCHTAFNNLMNFQLHFLWQWFWLMGI